MFKINYKLNQIIINIDGINNVFFSKDDEVINLQNLTYNKIDKLSYEINKKIIEINNEIKDVNSRISFEVEKINNTINFNYKTFCLKSV